MGSFVPPECEYAHVYDVATCQNTRLKARPNQLNDGPVWQSNISRLSFPALVTRFSTRWRCNLQVGWDSFSKWVDAFIIIIIFARTSSSLRTFRKINRPILGHRIFKWRLYPEVYQIISTVTAFLRHTFKAYLSSLTSQVSIPISI